MRKLLSLIALLIVGLVPIMADDSSGILIKGDRVSWDAVAAGDRLILNNATGTLDMAYANCKFADISDVFLNAEEHLYTTEGQKMDVNATPLSSANIFVLVEAPEQQEGVPSYYIQHEASKKYLKCEASSGYTYLTDGKNNGTSFEVIGALANYEPDGYGSWLTTGNVDDETAVFVHYEGDKKYHFGPFWNYGWTYYGTATDIIVWNLYRPAYSDKASDKLTTLYNQIKAENETFTIGTGPGYYPEDKVTAFEGIYITVDEYITAGGNDEAQCQTYYDNLKAAYETVRTSMIKITDGYYNFINDYAAYETYQGVQKAMSATQGQLTWKTYDPKDPTQLFKVTSLGDDTYSIQNVATGEYINTIDGQSSKVPMSAEQTTPQTFTLKAAGVWGIANTANTMDYHTDGHTSGRGISGNIVTWNGGAGTASAWIVSPVTDQALIDSLAEVGPKQVLVSKYSTVLASAKDMQEKIYDYTALITKGEQMASNAYQNGPMANLIDGDTSTRFHSTWDATTMKAELGEGNGWHNLQVTLDEPVNELFFRFTGVTGTTFHDTPNNIGVYVTNDDALGASTVAADSTQWIHFTDLTEGFPEDVEGAKYTSPILKFDDSYKYIRLVVRHTTHQGRDSERTFMNPFSTGVTFNLSEFQMYKPGYTATSEYETVEGMKAVADNLNTLINAAQDKINSMNVTESDIEAMNAAIKAVKAVYINRDSLYTELASAIASAEDVYNDAMGSKESLLTDASQLSSNNSSEINDVSSFEHLLDDETHYSHNFHSAWISASMTNADITAEEWEAALSTDDKYVFTGHGYHNLQVKLNQPVSSFWFEYVARTGTTYVDNPNDIEVYVTNDDALGESTDQAEIDQWTKLTELTEGFPESEAGAKYTSPVLKLEDGSTFKYVRFVIKNTALAGKTGFNRVFANPDVTGITWNVAIWRMYNGLDPQRVQYNYNEKMREAVDALKALIDEDSQVDKTTLLTNERQTALKAAADLVLSMYADTTEFAQLYSTYKEMVANSEVDADKALGYVDSQEAIDAFDAAINAAKANVDPIQPDKDKVDAAVVSMKEAYKTFMTHVGQVDPNKWYTIISGSSREKFIDQPIFLGGLDTGTQLSIGDYPIETKDPATDPYAIWRFVPVEGEEGQYYIQSLGTGQYFGDYRGQGSDAKPLMTHDKAPYYLPYFGGGKFKMQQVSAASENMLNCLKTDGTNSLVLNWPSNGDNQQTWQFKAIEDDESVLTINYLGNNTIRVMTLPFATKGDNSPMGVLNEGAVKSYAVKAMTTTEEGTTLELKLKQDFEAGEPFIMVLNDYTQYGEGEAQQPVNFLLPETVTDTSAIVANGLVGTLEGVTVAKPGMGIFVDAKLKASEANKFISGRDGYIDPRLVVNEEGDADLIITTSESITGVKSTVVINPTDKVNVYTIDGKLIKRNVKATDAQKSLKKGIYIVGKKKVAVK